MVIVIVLIFKVIGILIVITSILLIIKIIDILITLMIFITSTKLTNFSLA